MLTNEYKPRAYIRRFTVYKETYWLDFKPILETWHYDVPTKSELCPKWETFRWKIFCFYVQFYYVVANSNFTSLLNYQIYKCHQISCRHFDLTAFSGPNILCYSYKHFLCVKLKLLVTSSFVFRSFVLQPPRIGGNLQRKSVLKILMHWLFWSLAKNWT